MSTRCRIGIVQKDGTVKSIYCHHDGYLEGVGKILLKYYDTREKIEALVELGNISSLGRVYDKDLAWADKHRFDKDLTEEQKKKLDELRKLEEQESFYLTVPYGGDEKARIDDSIYDYDEKCGKCGEEFAYLWEADYNGIESWSVKEIPYFESLAEAIARKEGEA